MKKLLINTAIGALAIAGCATTDPITSYQPVVDPELISADSTKYVNATEKCEGSQ